MQNIINYDDKVALYENADIPAINKVQASDMNEIKSIVNGSLQGTNAMGSIVVDDISCKNLASFGYGSTTANQVTTTFDNSSFKINGTANASGFSFQKVVCTLPAGTYTLSTKLASGSKSGGNFQLSLVSGSTEYAIYNSNITDKTTTFTLTEETSLTFRLYINNTNSMTFNNMVINVQIEKGSVATEFTSFKGFGYESGNNSNGSYIKYDDGTMICYGNYSMSTTCSTALTNGGYRNSGGSTSLRVTYPQQFISAPSITVTTTSLNCIGCKPDSLSTTYFTALFVTINSESSATTKTANYVAIGRWK